MRGYYQWLDYELQGPPIISLDDYTFRSFGCEQLLGRYLSEISRLRLQNEATRWMLLDFWGRGKSTLMYNLCHEINNRLFFAWPEKIQTLAIFNIHPQKPLDLLDYSCQNGLPVPWNPAKNKDEVCSQRRQLLARANRILAFALMNKALTNPHFRIADRTQLISLAGTNILNQKPTTMIEVLDHLKSNNAYAIIVEYLEKYLQSLNFDGNDNLKELSDEQTLRHIANLVYPENSSIFLSSYSKLFGEPRRKLRNFWIFHSLCELANIHLLLVVDEAAEWEQFVKSELDDFLTELISANRLSAIVISRADVERKLRGQKRIRYFVLSYYYMKRMVIPDPTSMEILAMARGILATNRTKYCLSLFPFDEHFILSLSSRTMRSGHFNSRLFVRGISAALRLSLFWKRENAEITENFVWEPDLVNELTENLRAEDRKGLQPLDQMELSEEIRKKVQAARCISSLLLSGEIDPQTTYMFEIAHKIVAEYYQTSILSEIELLAYTEKKERTELSNAIKNLKVASVSPKAEAYLKEWIWKKVKRIV